MAVNSGADRTQTKDPSCGMPVDPEKTEFTVEMERQSLLLLHRVLHARFLEGPQRSMRRETIGYI